jgi:hypothetical protein
MLQLETQEPNVVHNPQTPSKVLYYLISGKVAKRLLTLFTIQVLSQYILITSDKYTSAFKPEYNDPPWNPPKSGHCPEAVAIQRVFKFSSMNLSITLACWDLGWSL